MSAVTIPRTLKWESVLASVDEELHRIDPVARIRIEDHIRDCGLRYSETKEAIKGLQATMSRLMFLMITTMLGAVVDILLRLLPNGHP